MPILMMGLSGNFCLAIFFYMENYQYIQKEESNASNQI